MNLPALKPAKKEKIHLVVVQGGFQPADAYAQKLLRSKRLKKGDIVGVVITKLRNPKFNRLVHKIGVLCKENIEDFSGMDAHAVIKRLQIEGNIYCDELAIKPYSIKIIDSILNAVKPILDLFGLVLTDKGMLIVRMPRSLSFDSMDEADFHDAAKQICRLIAERYWPDMTADQIEEMSSLMIDE